MVDDDLDAIRLLFGGLSRAVAARDFEGIEDLLDRDASQFAPGAPVIDGRTVILEGLRQKLCSWHPDLRLDCREIAAESEWGYCTGTFGLRSVCADGDTVRYTDGKFVAVVRRGTDGKWRLYRICYNSNLP